MRVQQSMESWYLAPASVSLSEESRGITAGWREREREREARFLAEGTYSLRVNGEIRCA